MIAQELLERGACAIADDVRAGLLSASEVLEHYLARIERLNPILGAFVFVDTEGARAAARSIDEQIARGIDPGPLAGVPLGVKEFEEVTGWPHTFACKLFADRVAGFTSTQVTRARGAGAVTVGLTAAPEFGRTSFTASELHGVTRNPWNLARTPGGSSGGSGAAVAAGLVPLATGSDSGGSLRIPASYSGLVGFKGTYGRVPRGPGYVGSPNIRNYGVLTSTVADTARFLDSVVGPDGRDPLALPHPGVSYETGVGAVELAGLRVAWTPGVGFAPSEPEVVATVRDGARALVDTTGMTEVAIDVDLPDPAVAWDVQGLPDLYGALKPFMPERSEEISPELQAAYEDAGKLTVDDFFRASMVRHALCQAVAELFEQIDLLLLPTTSTSAFAAEGPMPGEIAGIPVTPLESVAPTYTFNISGNPAVSVPAGEVDGAPVGLQIVGRHHDDLLVLAAAAALESARPWPRIAPEPALATDSR